MRYFGEDKQIIFKLSFDKVSFIFPGVNPGFLLGRGLALLLEIEKIIASSSFSDFSYNI